LLAQSPFTAMLTLASWWAICVVLVPRRLAVVITVVCALLPWALLGTFPARDVLPGRLRVLLVPPRRLGRLHGVCDAHLPLVVGRHTGGRPGAAGPFSTGGVGRAVAVRPGHARPVGAQLVGPGGQGSAGCMSGRVRTGTLGRRDRGGTGPGPGVLATGTCGGAGLPGGGSARGDRCGARCARGQRDPGRGDGCRRS